VPHGRIFMVGYKPSWVKNVEFIDGGNSAPNARANLWQNLWLACSHPELSDEIVITNDDVYIIGAVAEVPVLYRGLLADQVQKVTKRAGSRGWWQESLATTLAVLTAAGYADPLSYELHTPFPCNRHAMAETLTRYGHVTPHNPPQWRTLYGVTHQIGGTKGLDGKATRPGPVARPYHSTDDTSWRYFRARFSQMFPTPSPYERPTVDARSLVSVQPRNHLRSSRRARAYLPGG
jgi:hypothetical protein